MRGVWGLVVPVALAIVLVGTGCVGNASESTMPEDAPPVVQGAVVRVVDGDTARIVIDGVEEKVRFIGIDTPESTNRTEPYGAQSSDFTKSRLVGRTVWIETDAELRDRYDRLLAYVWLERPTSRSDEQVRRALFNAQLVAEGYAQIYTFPPNVRYQPLLLRLQREAREAGRGLWAVDGAADPLTGKRAEEPVY